MPQKIPRTVLLLLVLIFSLPRVSFAKNEVNLEDRIIASTFKGLAKSFLMVCDISKVKKSNSDKLRKMKEDKFNKRYAKVYEVIRGVPEPLKESYNLKDSLSKEEAILIVESLDKKKINQIIDAIPDQLIADYFKEYLNKKPAIPQAGAGFPGKGNILEEVNKIWNKIMSKQ